MPFSLRFLFLFFPTPPPFYKTSSASPLKMRSSSWPLPLKKCEVTTPGSDICILISPLPALQSTDQPFLTDPITRPPPPIPTHHTHTHTHTTSHATLRDTAPCQAGHLYRATNQIIAMQRPGELNKKDIRRRNLETDGRSQRAKVYPRFKR